ncbi:MAG: IS1634 family transposase [Candidatus Bathyarchaeota archaeon]|nr:IS1634 family transposase [Candidatus Bathyarchaeota archaeon]
MSEEQIQRLTASFIRATGMEKRFGRVDFEAGKGYHYGSILPVIALWHQLGLEQIIDGAVSAKVAISVSRIALIQTANRFSEPGSKLACFRWYYRSLFCQMKNFVNFPEDEDEELHTYYRALDYLCEAKENIEKQLYYRLLGYGLDNSLILYDITSTYFEGEQAEIGKQGFSRDRRGDLDQIVVGLVMSRDGIPIAHHVFEGNRLDKTTVQEVVEDLKQRFGIKKAIIVGDRGMITIKNIEMIKGHEYEYILGLQKRNRKVVDHLLEKVLKNPDEPLQEFGYSDLSSTLQKKYQKGVRFIAGYNKKVARKTGGKRDRNIALFRKLIEEAKLVGDLKTVKKSNDRLKSFLSKKHITRLYKLSMEKVEGEDDVYRLEVQEIEVAIKKEENLDGLYFIQTEVSEKLDKAEIERAYKSLQKVEQAFRIVKDKFDIRPVHVRLETRIRGHVMVSYFALLIETLLEKKVKEIFPEAYDKYDKVVKRIRRTGEEPLTMMTLFEELDDVRLIPLEFKSENGKAVKISYISTKIDNDVKKVLSSLGVRNAMNPEKLSFQSKNKSDKEQLVLDLGLEYMN